MTLGYAGEISRLYSGRSRNQGGTVEVANKGGMDKAKAPTPGLFNSSAAKSGRRRVPQRTSRRKPQSTVQGASLPDTLPNAAAPPVKQTIQAAPVVPQPVKPVRAPTRVRSSRFTAAQTVEQPSVTASSVQHLVKESQMSIIRHIDSLKREMVQLKTQLTSYASKGKDTTDLESNIKQLTEQLAVLQESVSANHDGVTSVTEANEKVKNDLDEVRSKVDALAEEIKTIGTHMDKVHLAQDHVEKVEQIVKSFQHNVEKQAFENVHWFYGKVVATDGVSAIADLNAEATTLHKFAADEKILLHYPMEEHNDVVYVHAKWINERAQFGHGWVPLYHKTDDTVFVGHFSVV